MLKAPKGFPREIREAESLEMTALHLASLTAVTASTGKTCIRLISNRERFTVLGFWNNSRIRSIGFFNYYDKEFQSASVKT